MLKTYDSSEILSIISAKESKSTITDFTSLTSIDSAVTVINKPTEIEPFDLKQCLFLLKFSEDPYDILSDIYWTIAFQS